MKRLLTVAAVLLATADCSHPATDRAQQGTMSGAKKGESFPKDLWCIVPQEQTHCFDTLDECDQERLKVLGDRGSCDQLTVEGIASPAPAAPH